jgi:hypothetical protein
MATHHFSVLAATYAAVRLPPEQPVPAGAFAALRGTGHKHAGKRI